MSEDAAATKRRNGLRTFDEWVRQFPGWWENKSTPADAVNMLYRAARDGWNGAMDERDDLWIETEERVAELERLLEAVHAPHPSPDLCTACAAIGRRL